MSRIHADGHGIMCHTGTHEPDGCHHGFGAGLAGKFPIGGLHIGDGANGLGYDGRGGLDCVGVRFGAHPDRPRSLRLDTRPQHGIPRSFNRHGGYILVQARDGFFLDRQPTRTIRPYPTPPPWRASGNAGHKPRIRRSPPDGWVKQHRFIRWKRFIHLFHLCSWHSFPL